ncbi:MAG: hypothetical protein P1V51_24170 [Deltaproteobacteria bacterium]|nr:hypothetical protein [Deltaproteobacteria bacterium]
MDLSMGVALSLSILASFLLGGLVAFTSWLGWRTGLKLELALLVFTGLLLAGFVLERGARRKKAPLLAAWPLLLAIGGGALAGLSFLLGGGPAIYPPVIERSIDLGAWTLAGGGAAGALVALIFGALATREGGALRAAAGLLCCGLGLLSLQPALAAAGQPTVGPLGLGVAVAAVVAYRLTRRS